MRLIGKILAVLLGSTVLGEASPGDILPKTNDVDHRDDNAGVVAYVDPTRSLRRAYDKRTRNRDLIVGGILCQNDVPTRCICSTDELLEAFDKASTNARRITRIPLCYGSFFPLDKPINITGKAFALKCIRPEQCTFRGMESNVFVGAPLVARFIFLSFEFGEAEKGGAIHLTGGKTRFINMYINGNEANSGGGAVYIEGKDTLLAMTGTIFTENYSNGTGGAIVVANGAELRSTRSSFLVNGAETEGGAIYNNGGTVKLTFSLFSENYATTGNDMVNTAKNGTGSTASVVDCASILKVTFCDGKEGIVTTGSATSNCLQTGLFRFDPRCFILGLGPEDD